KLITSFVAFLLLVASLCLIPILGFSCLPTEEQKMLYITYTPEPGETEDTILQNVSEVEQEMMAREDVEVVQLSIGSSDNMMMGMGSNNGALMFIIFNEETENFDEVTKEI